ncbi:ATP-binding cassette domain-containing protein [Shinella sp. AETb1-6]|uniref:ABC transporter ATP-binding protein n=1 Tax=Shinella oryzae TaxID=2871820 RepID=A0ABY9KED1_9HYPH|nr:MULTISPECIES: ABC transporter ATP-binding protein [Shinella]MXN50893.1 ATP-binding cassette domain-containing protein [Shinella sp. AETb1-6]MCD1262677.1 ATP-binding cassette domain-containing protein [Shinella sumterensis]TFE98803.1 branched-chain amino acid ABC transporter ATP-binding protein [Shinella sumterensis]WLS06179.1 ABC transporter ATP-binding protein [Shinella oryzae]WLS11395.1 ABC transporter ATP-binding protein [Shinella sumterensis]
MSASTQPPVLSLSNVVSGYKGLQVLKGISFDIAAGDFVTVVGPNGHGKSTLLKTISGLVPLTSGAIRINGEPAPGKPHTIAGLGVAHVPQGDMLFPEMSVLENLLMGAYLAPSKAEIDRRLDEVYTLLPKLSDRRDQVASSLSGGERRMVGIGRGLMMGGQILLIDEPSLGLAPLIIEQIYGVITELSRSGRTILLVEENPARVADLADHLHLLDDGIIVWSGPPAELLARDELLATYLGG